MTSERSVAYKVWPQSLVFGEGPPHVVIYLENLDEALDYVIKNNIKSIDLSTHEPHKKSTQIDLNFLRKLNNITGFGCRFEISKKTDISPIYDLKKLKQLAWPAAAPDIDLSKFVDLEYLMCCYSASTQGLELLAKLKYLRLSVSSNRDLGFLGNLKSLEKIEIANSPIESMSGIERLTKLTEAVIFPLPKLVDISSIAECKGLKTLHFEKMKNLTDYSALGRSKSIENLEILTPIDSVEFVPRMKSLKKFFCHEIKSNDLTPLLSAKSLKCLDFHPEKRSYTHSLAEIKSLLKI
jgi:hypothetical protein